MAGNLTAGHINVTPMRLRTTLSLTQLRNRMREQIYSGDIYESGWGSIQDPTDRLGSRQATRPRGGDPSTFAERGPVPRRLMARLYFSRYDRLLARRLGDSATPDQLRPLDAVDVVISDFDDEFKNVLVSTQTPSDLTGVVPNAFARLCGGPNEERCLFDGSLTGTIDNDLFLWLVYRLNGDRQLSDDLELLSIRSVRSEDAQFRGTQISEDASLDRSVVLAVVSNEGSHYGPAKLAVSSKKLGLTADFELREDGGFSPFVQWSEYNDGDLNERATFGPRITADIFYSIVPDIRAAYRADSDWASGGRDKFIAAAKSALSKIT